MYFGHNRLRFRYDLMSSNDQEGQELLEKFKNIANELIRQKRCLIPEKYCVIVDNHRLLHARTVIKDERRFLQRIRFDMENPRLNNFIQKN